MSKKTAVVLGYSAECADIAKQCIASCFMSSKAECDFFAFQLNWIVGTNTRRPYQPHIKLADEFAKKEVSVIDIDASEIPMPTCLPDITVYDYFAKKYLKDYDYTLFCHDDLIFHRSNMLQVAQYIVDKPGYNIIAEPHIECTDIVSVRFYPYFIFVHNKKFLESDLSFVNNYTILSYNLRARQIDRDGGAGLFASYYRQKHLQYKPYTMIPKTWFTHIKSGNDNGVETLNLLAPSSVQFQTIIQAAQKYVDEFLYGE